MKKIRRIKINLKIQILNQNQNHGGTFLKKPFLIRIFW
jgi:hypothetical protein